jgi:hypothetical protein
VGWFLEREGIVVHEHSASEEADIGVTPSLT